MAKKKEAAPSLFGPVENPPLPQAPRPPEPPRADACPRCGGKSLRSLRPEEHGGRTHYCVEGCKENDDMFYFTPDPNAPPRPKLVAVDANNRPSVEPVAAVVESEVVVPCPRCGRPAQKSKRPQEYGGRTHYCAMCEVSSNGDLLRFTPGKCSERCGTDAVGGGADPDCPLHGIFATKTLPPIELAAVAVDPPVKDGTEAPPVPVARSDEAGPPSQERAARFLEGLADIGSGRAPAAPEPASVAAEKLQEMNSLDRGDGAPSDRPIRPDEKTVVVAWGNAAKRMCRDAGVPFRTVVVHLADEPAAKEFAGLIGSDAGETWFPPPPPAAAVEDGHQTADGAPPPAAAVEDGHQTADGAPPPAAAVEDGQFVFFEELTWEQAPTEFPEYDENIEYGHECASCKYRWSGGPGGEDEDVDVEESLKTCPRCGAEWRPPEVPESLAMFADLKPEKKPRPEKPPDPAKKKDAKPQRPNMTEFLNRLVQDGKTIDEAMAAWRSACAG